MDLKKKDGGGDGKETKIAAPWVKKGKVYPKLPRLSSGKQREAGLGVGSGFYGIEFLGGIQLVN